MPKTRHYHWLIKSLQSIEANLTRLCSFRHSECLAQALYISCRNVRNSESISSRGQRGRRFLQDSRHNLFLPWFTNLWWVRCFVVFKNIATKRTTSSCFFAKKKTRVYNTSQANTLEVESKVFAVKVFQDFSLFIHFFLTRIGGKGGDRLVSY